MHWKEKKEGGNSEWEGERETIKKCPEKFYTATMQASFIQTHLLILKLKSLVSTLLTVTSDMLTLYTAPYSNSSVILILMLTILLISVAILQLLVGGGDTSEQ